ncbi:hypothetical protein [Aquimarina sp. BL5]|uniref:hypothetical protein n=1 Tax=Aquimarina sp. BL5 TaxID=1714860 RepID=UPI0013143F26|nr:hypothetical protein [Aquimarina sp. BL5]
MSTSFKISIPKPCRENWDTMTPNEQGRFCTSCSKTVIDFTEKSIPVIKDFLIQNHEKQVCGRFTNASIDNLIVSIPEEVIQRDYSFRQLFLLVLLITMGTTLFSCSDSNGTSKKISAVEIIATDTIQQKAIKADSTIKVCEGKKQVEQDVSIVSKTGKDSLRQKVPIPTRRIMGEPEVIMGGMSIDHIDDVKYDSEVMVPYISKSDFKNKLILVSQKKLSAKDFESYLGGNLNLLIIVNRKRTTFLEFCKKIEGKEIKFKEIEISRNGNNVIRNIVLIYKKTSIF